LYRLREMELVMSLAGVDEATARTALLEYETVEDAVDALLVKPVVSGDAYIRPRPMIETGMTSEQEERCRKGRWLQDQVNAVFSVAHSQTQTPPVPEVPEAVVASRPGDESPAQPVAPPGSPQDSHVQMTLPTLQSLTPQ
jgi:hypothetical protein